MNKHSKTCLINFSLSRFQNLTVQKLWLQNLQREHGFLRDEIIKEELKEETILNKGSLTGFYEAFKKYLISDLSMGGFVDLFSQTIVYGLFAARMRAGENFDRRHAYDNIPKTIGILSELFEFISLGENSRTR